MHNAILVYTKYEVSLGLAYAQIACLAGRKMFVRSDHTSLWEMGLNEVSGTIARTLDNDNFMIKILCGSQDRLQAFLNR